MRRPKKRLLATLLLVGWTIPALATLGLGLHVAIDHHHSPDSRHAEDLSGLIQAIEHGHHHDGDAAPDHRHEARLGGRGPALQPTSKIAATLPHFETTQVTVPLRPTQTVTSRRGPPTTPLASFSSLLL